jgi:cardiolipin synthase
MEVGASVHLQPSGIVHAKVTCIHGQIGMLGTANLDRRSLFLNYEVALLLLDEQSGASLAAAAHGLLRAAQRVDPEVWSRRPRKERILQDSVNLLSPLL